MKQYQFHYRNRYAAEGISLALKNILQGKIPVIVAIGTDIVVGDALGPTTGSMIKHLNPSGAVIGSLHQTITAKEVRYLNDFLRNTYPDRPILAVDAAVGYPEDVGVIQITESSIYPSSGIKSARVKIGDVSIQGILAERTALTITKLKEIRVHVIYQMAKLISDGVVRYLNNYVKN